MSFYPPVAGGILVPDHFKRPRYGHRVPRIESVNGWFRGLISLSMSGHGCPPGPKAQLAGVYETSSVHRAQIPPPTCLGELGVSRCRLQLVAAGMRVESPQLPGGMRV